MALRVLKSDFRTSESSFVSSYVIFWRMLLLEMRLIDCGFSGLKLNTFYICGFDFKPEQCEASELQRSASSHLSESTFRLSFFLLVKTCRFLSSSHPELWVSSYSAVTQNASHVFAWIMHDGSCSEMTDVVLPSNHILINRSSVCLFVWPKCGPRLWVWLPEASFITAVIYLSFI